MPGEPKRLYWDSPIFLSYVNGIADRLPDIDALLTEAERGEVEIVTSTFTMAEVAFAQQEQVAQQLDAETEARINGLWQPPIKLVEFHALIAAQAAQLMRSGLSKGWTLKAPDAVHLATAVRAEAAEFNTYDGALTKWAAEIGIPVCPPHPEQPTLLS
jgi:predicted nucleic acid-binding protein